VKKHIFFSAILISYLLSLISTSAFAQEETIDAKANAILQSLDKKTKTYKTIKAEFTLTIYGKDGKPGDAQTGTIWINGAKYKLDLKNQTIFCDSSTTWTYLKDANEVQINNVDPNSDKGSLSPSTIFTVYEKGFKSHFEKEETTNNVTTEEVDLYPKHPEKEKYHTIKLFIDKAKNQVTEVKIMMKDGTTQLYMIDKFTPNSAMPLSDFTFDPKSYPGVDVEDLRQ